jgi:hypothetical protein
VFFFRFLYFSSLEFTCDIICSKHVMLLMKFIRWYCNGVSTLVYPSLQIPANFVRFFPLGFWHSGRSMF